MAHKKEKARSRRKAHIRKKLAGTTQRPRVFVYKSNSYTYAGVADDDMSKVLFSVSGKKGVEAASKMGKSIGKKLKKDGYESVVFDRSGYRYHGVVAAIADGVRSAGIEM